MYYIVSVIPLVKIPLPAPQTLDYFSAVKISVGGVVRIRVGKTSLLGVVVSCESVSRKKQYIKKSSFALKPIEEALNPNSLIPRHHIALVLWAASYFYSPLGLTMKSFLPRAFARPTKKFLTELSALRGSPAPKPAKIKKPLLYWNGHRNKGKIDYYTGEINAALGRGEFVLFLVPELYKIEYFRRQIPLLANKLCIVGTRSALSIPRQNLGLIIVDDEESPYYKSFDQQPYINARDAALKLAELTGAKIILSSNLPSVESFWKAKSGEYALAGAGAREAGGRAAKMEVVDMRQELKGGNYSIFSGELREKLREVVRKKKRAILFINRKGLNSGLLCRDCGHIINCPNCDVAMVYHEIHGSAPKTNRILICHHCGHRRRPPSVCPKCESYKIKFIGTGTQRVEEELIKSGIAPRGKIVRLDRDAAPTAERQKEAFARFGSREAQILICTQLGLKMELLPRPELSAIITADPLLNLPDFRMREYFMRIVDKLWTISATTFLLQTYIMDNPILDNVCNNYDVSLMSEIKNRKMLSLPPFSQLVMLTCGHRDPQKAEGDAQILKNKLHQQLAACHLPLAICQILGPAPGYIPRVGNRYIWQIMIKSKIEDLLLRNKILRIVPSNWRVDIDPIQTI